MSQKEHNKITQGYVVQTYITLPDGTKVCKAQEFIAGDPVDYETMDGQPVLEDDITDNEVYCPFEMKQPKQIPDPEDAVKFVCPACGDTHIEAVLDGSHTTRVAGMFKCGSIEYGDTESNGDLDRFQCVACGFDIVNGSGNFITTDSKLVDWCRKNCKTD